MIISQLVMHARLWASRTVGSAPAQRADSLLYPSRSLQPPRSSLHPLVPPRLNTAILGFAVSPFLRKIKKPRGKTACVTDTTLVIQGVKRRTRMKVLMNPPPRPVFDAGYAQQPARQDYTAAHYSVSRPLRLPRAHVDSPNPEVNDPSERAVRAACGLGCA